MIPVWPVVGVFRYCFSFRHRVLDLVCERFKAFGKSVRSTVTRKRVLEIGEVPWL